MIYNKFVIPDILVGIIAEHFAGGRMEIHSRPYHPLRDGSVREADNEYPPTINTAGDTLPNPIGAWGDHVLSGTFYFSDSVREMEPGEMNLPHETNVIMREVRQPVDVNGFVRVSAGGMPRYCKYFDKDGVEFAWSYAVSADERLPQHPEVFVAKGGEDDFDSFLLNVNDLIAVKKFEFAIREIVYFDRFVDLTYFDN